MRSSYVQHDFAKVFHAIVTAYLPVKCVELGVLEGYSTVAIGRALKENAERRGTHGQLEAYDLFEDYPYRHSTLETAWGHVVEAGLERFVSIQKADAFTVHERYLDNAVHFLHVDLSNTGETLCRIMEAWDTKLTVGGIICFEGGSEERDRVDWMVEHHAPPIKAAMESNPLIAAKYVFGTYAQFPSLTTLLKKRH